MDPRSDGAVVEEVGRDGRLRTITGNFQCQMQLSQQRTISVTGYIFSDDSPDQVNARLDQFQDALDRQFIRCDLVNKEAQVKAIMAEVERYRDTLDGLAAKSAGTGTGLSAEKQGKKLSSQERLTLQNGQQTVKKQLEYVDSLRAAIREGRAKLGLPVA